MADKNKMVDFPKYDPDAHVPFPPGEGAPFGQQPKKKAAPPAPPKTPYYERYDPDPPSPDPSQTSPGAVDIRDIDARVGDDALSALSPDIDLKE